MLRAILLDDSPCCGVPHRARRRTVRRRAALLRAAQLPFRCRSDSSTRSPPRLRSEKLRRQPDQRDGVWVCQTVWIVSLAPPSANGENNLFRHCGNVAAQTRSGIQRKTAQSRAHRRRPAASCRARWLGAMLRQQSRSEETSERTSAEMTSGTDSENNREKTLNRQRKDQWK